MPPLVFIIDIHDLSKYLIECKVNSYADDVALYIENKSYIDLMLTLRIEISTVQQWLYANKVTRNVCKTKLMIFGAKNKLKDIPISLIDLKIHNEKIELLNEFKYLCVILDNTLNFNAHIY